MSEVKLTIVHLGRRGALGERRRVEAWRALADGAAVTVSELSLMTEHRRGLRVPGPSELIAAARRRSVLESLAWDQRGAAAHLRRESPDVVVFVGARAYHPRLHGIARREVLDFVDRMSVAYADRSEVVRERRRRFGFRVLSWSHRGFESRIGSGPARRVAAGRRDADALVATWLPIPLHPVSRSSVAAPDHDLIFFGTLAYPPNIAAVRRLGRVWPALLARRPGLSMLLAGATPTDEVRGLAADHGWDLIEGFQDVGQACARARVAVVPLDHATGIQIKVLEAAAAGLPQVVSPPALRGLDPGFPALVVENDAELVEGVLRLLGDEGMRRSLAEAACRHVHERYSVERWQPVVAALLGVELREPGVLTARAAPPAPAAPRFGLARQPGARVD